MQLMNQVSQSTLQKNCQSLIYYDTCGVNLKDCELDMDNATASDKNEWTDSGLCECGEEDLIIQTTSSNNSFNSPARNLQTTYICTNARCFLVKRTEHVNIFYVYFSYI